MRGKTAFLKGTLFLSYFLLLASCDQTFDPLQESDVDRFSMFGFLDASVDTQWVRITPLRQQLSQPPEKPLMKLTLTDLNHNNSSVMNDSLFLNPDGFHVIMPGLPRVLNQINHIN